MNPQNPDKNLIDRYLRNELSGIELENFRERMRQDEPFKNDVNFQVLLRSGILFSKEEELRKKILERINFRQPRIPFALKLIFTFLLVTGLGITLWFYVGPDSSGHTKNYSLFSFMLKEKDKKPEKKSGEEADKYKTGGGEARQVSREGENLSAKDEADGIQAASTGDTGEKVSANDSTAQATDEDKDIVIKKEKLLISTTLSVIDKPAPDVKTTDQSQNSDLTHDAIEKLNPSAGIPEEEKATSNYFVEFWVSPINYRGYKMSKNKLILYGIEEPDAVRLYRWKDLVFMKYGSEFFRLVNTFDYIPYQRIKEADVPLAIRQ